MSYEEADLDRYIRKIAVVDSEPDFRTINHSQGTFKAFLAVENYILTSIFKKNEGNINEILIKIEDIITELGVNEQKFVDFEALKTFVLNFSNDCNLNESIKDIGVQKMPDLKELLAGEQYNSLLKQPFRARSLMELYLKKLLLIKSADFNENRLREFDFWLGFFLENKRIWLENETLRKKYQKLKKLDADLITIYLAKKISLLTLIPDPVTVIVELLKLYGLKDVLQLLKLESQIMIIYNICRHTIPLIQKKAWNKPEIQKMKENVKFFVEFYKDLNLLKFNLNSLQNWNDFFLLCFCLIDALLAKQLDKYTVRKDKNLEERIKNLEESSQFEGFSMEEAEQKIEATMLHFCCCNFSRTKKFVNDRVKGIIGHKIAALLMVYTKITNNNDFLSKYMEDILQKPFDDEIFLMKLCVNLFLRDELLKCYNICQMVLESETLKMSRFLPIIINLCTYLNCKMLGKSEEGLLYAKLNLNNYTKIMKKEYPIRLEMIYASLAFCYYGISEGCYYSLDRNENLAKATEYFEISLKINPENYLIAHYLAKCLAKHSNLDAAIINAKKAITLNRFHTPSYLLLALVFSAKNDLKMANSIIEEILSENPFNPVFYIIK